jgi:HEAT repeat protein
MRSFTWGTSGLIVAIGLLAGLGQPAQAQSTGNDPCEELRQLLRNPQRDSAERQRDLARQLESVQSLEDQGKVLLLQEWCCEEDDAEGAKMDQTAWRALAERFRKQVRADLQGADESRRLAAIRLLGEMGALSRELDNRWDVVRDLGPDLAIFMKQGQGEAVEAVARTLGLINPDPLVAVPALKGLFETGDIGKRLAAADGLCALVNSATALALAYEQVDKKKAFRGQAGVVGCLVVPVAGLGLSDVHPGVRRRCVEAMRAAGGAVTALVHDIALPDDPDEWKAFRLEVERERGALGPLVLALEAQGPALGLALTDPDSEVRVAARHALQELAQARHCLLLRANTLAAVAPGNRRVGMLEGERAASAGLPLPALIAELGDPDVATRLSALDVLESVGPAAAPAAAAVVKALGDPNPFVRWAAARTLGKIGAVEAETAVPALARMLADADRDLRLAAATTLGMYGPTARAAVGALIQTMNSGDSALRSAALAALEQIGPGAEPAIPAISAALTDRDARVRQSAARLLGRFGPSAGNARDALLLKLNDSSLEVRTAAHDALLHIIGPPN